MSIYTLPAIAARRLAHCRPDLFSLDTGSDTPHVLLSRPTGDPVAALRVVNYRWLISDVDKHSELVFGNALDAPAETLELIPSAANRLARQLPADIATAMAETSFTMAAKLDGHYEAGQAAGILMTLALESRQFDIAEGWIAAGLMRYKYASLTDGLDYS